MAQYSTLMRAETETEAEDYMNVLRETTAYPKYKASFVNSPLLAPYWRRQHIFVKHSGEAEILAGEA